MSGSDADDDVEDQAALDEAARENFDEETEIQEEDHDNDAEPA